MAQLERFYALLQKMTREGLLPTICLIFAIFYVWQDRESAVKGREDAFTQSQIASRQFLDTTRSDREAIIKIISENTRALADTVNAIDNLKGSQDELTIAIRQQTSEMKKNVNSSTYLSRQLVLSN